jgi:hypothetical protein
MLKDVETTRSNHKLHRDATFSTAPVAPLLSGFDTMENRLDQKNWLSILSLCATRF